MIKFDGVNKSYGNKMILENFNLLIKQNKGIVSLIGPNGAGKSTLLRLLSGILKINAGSISILEGEDFIKQDDINLTKKVAFMSSSERMLDYKLSVSDNIIYFNILKGMFKKQITENLNEVILDIGLNGFEDRLVETLSTGQKRKVSIGCILSSDCKIIVLDEPTLGLDYDAKMDLKRILLKDSIHKKKLFVISSHDFNFLSNLSEENIFIHETKIKNKINHKISQEELVEIYNGGCTDI